jgi:23S rRNA (cytosine1962-C5)-methyltransferase
VLSLEALSDPGALVRERLRATLARRLERIELGRTNAFRLAHGEADGLRGVHVDVYGNAASVRFDGAGARAFYGELWPALLELEPLGIESIVDRDRRGAGVALEVVENGLRFAVDLGSGQKGGLFLDQRENRAEVERRARGLRVLNLFGYTGAFSLYAARGGAKSTDTVDRARPALEAARTNFERNGLAGPSHRLHALDAFSFLESASRERKRWDLVISDPPSFARSKGALPAARDAYRRLHALGASVVAPGGLLCPASCSSHVGREEFLRLVDDGVERAGRRIEVLDVRGAGFDHPSLPGFPEGDYLKFVLGTVS